MATSSRASSQAIALDLAEGAFGIVTRRELAEHGVTRHVMRRHIDAGRWQLMGTGAIRVLAAPWCPQRSPIAAAVANGGRHAWAEGEASLLLAGLTGWRPTRIDVGLPRTTRAQPVAGVVYRQPSVESKLASPSVRRSHPAMAVLRAAAWADTDRQAGTLIAMTVQQRLVRPAQVVETLELLPKLRRRSLIRAALGDVIDGAHSLGELDFTALCRRRGLPRPSRQELREGEHGRMYLDVRWEAARLVVEIDGAHHLLGDNPTRDALRANQLALEGETVIRVPVVALRTTPDPFFAQIERHLRRAGIL